MSLSDLAKRAVMLAISVIAISLFATMNVPTAPVWLRLIATGEAIVVVSMALLPWQVDITTTEEITP